jgi:hypothetical protein
VWKRIIFFFVRFITNAAIWWQHFSGDMHFRCIDSPAGMGARSLEKRFLIRTAAVYDGIRPQTDGTAKEERERPKTVFDALTQTAVNYFTYSREICQHRHVFRINGVVGYLYCIKRKGRLKVN